MKAKVEPTVNQWFVRNLRAARGETGEEFAKVVGASPRAVTAWESGYHTPRGLYRKALLELWEQMQREEVAATELSREEARRILNNPEK